MIELSQPGDLTRDLYRRIAHDGEAVALAPSAVERVEHSRAQFLRHLQTGVVCYGVNTGLGALAGLDLTPQEMERLPRHILLGRAAAIGPGFPSAAVRGAMLVKLVQFLSGTSAVTADLCRFMADRLNDGFMPHVPSEGLGMAGEIIPLCHLAQTFVGEGFVLGPTAGQSQTEPTQSPHAEAPAEGGPRSTHDGVSGAPWSLLRGRPDFVGSAPQDEGGGNAIASRRSGARIPAADWFRDRGIRPYEPKSKEGLSLINGVALAPALAFDLGLRLRRTLAFATLAAGTSIEGLGASLEPYSDDVWRLRREPGVEDIAYPLQRLLDSSQVTRNPRQPPVSFRVIPQVHGVCRDAIHALEVAIVTEWQSIGDNPAFIADDTSPTHGRLVHSGNFHCAALTAAVEAAALASAQIGLLSERRLHRVLDERFSKLSPQLAGRPGLDAGLVILHKAALGLTAKIRSLAVPPSLQHGESSFGQEDFMTMIFPALDRLGEIDRLVRLTCVYELYAALVAIDRRGETPGDGIARVRDVVRAEIPAYDGDRPYGAEIERLAELVESGAIPLPDLL